ncbi:aldehyde dehydrogenase family protein [Paraburkholderia sp. SIMBA_049]
MNQPTSFAPLNEAAQRFLLREQHGLFIDGQQTSAASNKTFETRDPSTGKVLGHLAEGGDEDIDRAVRAARAAFTGPWSRWTPYERQALLHRAHDIMERHFDELAEIESMDMGAPISRMRGAKDSVLKMIQFFAAQTGNIAGETLQNGLPGDVVTMSMKAPVGIVGGIIPWNGPLISQWWILGTILASGCTTVLKPAEDASLSVLRVVELLHEVGLPSGVVNVVTGMGAVAGAALARHPGVDRIAFTGSTETGRKIIEASTTNIKKLQLELGGKSPDIIFADADLDKAVPGAAMGVFANSGQICFAGTRVLVQRPIVNEFCARVAEFARAIRVGRSLDVDATRQRRLGHLRHAMPLKYLWSRSRVDPLLVGFGGTKHSGYGEEAMTLGNQTEYQQVCLHQHVMSTTPRGSKILHDTMTGQHHLASP